MGFSGSKPLKTEGHVQPRFQITLIELFVFVSITVVISSELPGLLWWPFPEHFALGCTAIFAGIMAVAAPSGRSRDVAAALAAILGGVVVWCVLGVDPLRTTLHAATFQDVPTAEVLQAIARRDRGHVKWEFRVRGQRIAKQKLTIEIPEGATTRKTLDRIARATHCTYRWYWFSSSCFAQWASSVRFVFLPDDPHAVSDRNMVYIGRNHIEAAPD